MDILLTSRRLASLPSPAAPNRHQDQAMTTPPAECFLDIGPDHDFSYQNLPYGVFSTPHTAPRVGVAIGDWVLDLSVLAEETDVFR